MLADCTKLALVFTLGLLLVACDARQATSQTFYDILAREDQREDETPSFSPIQLRTEDDAEALQGLSEISRQNGNKAVGAYLLNQSKLALANEYVGLTVSFGDGEAGILTLWDQDSGQQLLQGVPSFGKVFETDIAPPFEPANYRFEQVTDEGLGLGLRLEADLVAYTGNLITQVATLYDEQHRLTYQLVASTAGETVFRYFDAEQGSQILTGAEIHTVTDPDALLPLDAIGLGRPLVISGDEAPGTLVFAMVDQTESWAYFAIGKPGESAWAPMTLEYYDVSNQTLSEEQSVSPRLLIEYSPTHNAILATQGYREVMGHLYPAPPIPQWLRYQWLSWYVYYIGVDEAAMRRHIDYIAHNLSDLGPWHVLLDAGWYITEGRPGADWKAVDKEKFPSGIRALVDYAHAKGSRVVLYFSLPYLDDNREEGNWNGLRGLIEQEPEWLIPIGDAGGIRRFVYDLHHPGFQSYLRDVMEDFFLDYNVDGIKVDGLGNALEPTLAYRMVYEAATALKDGVYIEGGWQNPIYAHPYSHTFRYGDEAAAFDSVYPNGGLKQHIDYALYQNFILGQRSNVGAITGRPDDLLGLRWFEASLALGSQVSLSFDFSAMSPQTLSEYRARLLHYQPFVGERRISGPVGSANSFSYQVGDVTYLGVINRETAPQLLRVGLAEHGLPTGQPLTVYDVATRSSSTVSGSLSISLKGEEFRLFVIKTVPGPIWTNSSVQLNQRAANSFDLTARGPAVISGFMDLFVPSAPLRLEIDGNELGLQEQVSEGGYSYNAETGVLRLRYDHFNPHRIVVRW